MNLLRYFGLRTLKRNMSGKMYSSSVQLTYIQIIFSILLIVMKSIYSGSPCVSPTEDEFKLQRVLLVLKTTRLEMEKMTRTDAIDADLRSILIERGSDFLVKSHDEHKRFEKEVIQSLEQLNVEVKLVSR